MEIVIDSVERCCTRSQQVDEVRFAGESWPSFTDILDHSRTTKKKNTQTCAVDQRNFDVLAARVDLMVNWPLNEGLTQACRIEENVQAQVWVSDIIFTTRLP